MAKEEVNPLVLVAIAVVVIGLVVFFGFRATQPPSPPAGSYKPGVPPWLDPSNPQHGKIKPPPGTRVDASPPAATAHP